MRWSIIRLISYREIRDQLRDRRTLLLILGLPIVVYPLFVGVSVLFAQTLKSKRLIVGVVNARALPVVAPWADGSAVAGVAAGVLADRYHPYPALLENDSIAPEYLPDEADLLGGSLEIVYLEEPDEELLNSRQVDALLVIDPQFLDHLRQGIRPQVQILARDAEENSKLAMQRLNAVLRKWQARLKQVHLIRAGLPPDFDQVLEIKDPQSDKSTQRKLADEIRDALVKAIPFLLVMWMMTGAIYPAIDMTAGEKERGTMETLLISPTYRSEVVAGKFLAISTLSFATGVWNVLLLMIAVGVAQSVLHASVVFLPGLALGLLAALPLACVFAALCLTLGVFARSTKEGNYYMVPLVFVVLPLAYYSMVPGSELDAGTSWVPLTNVLLLQQRLLSVRSDPFPWQHLPALVASSTLCVVGTFAMAVLQFQRESILFREDTGVRASRSLFGWWKESSKEG